MSRSSFGRFFARFFLLGLILLGSPLASAQDYVGVLPEMLKPEVADRLGLSEAQRGDVRDLIRQRSSAAIALAQQLREATPDQQQQLRADFGATSEQMAFKLLDAGQQDKLAKYRIEWKGMLSLADPEVAKSLNLADWQQKIVADWAAKASRERRGPSAERTRNEAQRAIRGEISESQWDAWQLMAGLINESTSGPPMPPVFEEASPADGGAPIVAASAEQNAFLPVEDVRLELNFQGQPWSDVIRWFATQADLSLQSDIVPPGSFNYRDRARTYSVTEAMDIMNASLLSTGHTLIKTGRMLRCVNFEEQEIAKEYISEVADWVDEQELVRRGDFEPVKFTFQLKRLDPEDVSADIEQLVSVHGTVKSIPSAGEIVVTDMARNVRAILSMIQRAEDPQSGRGSSIQTFALEHINAEEVLAVARPLLALEEETNTSDEIKISTDTFGTKIYFMGEADKVQNLRDLVEQMDVPPSEEEGVIEYETPELRRHKVVGIDMELAYQIVSQLMAGAPDVRLAQDTASKQLMLMARPSEHELVEETLAKLAGESTDFQVIQLNKLDVQLAINAIKKFFGLTDDADGEGGGPVIDGDIFARQVWVKGSSTQVEQIRKFLKDLEENASNSNLLGDNMISIPLSGRSAEKALSQVQQLWDQMNNRNRLRFIEAPGSRSSSRLQQKSFAPNTDSKEAASLDRAKGDAPIPVRAAERTDGKRAARGGVPAGRLTAFPQEDASASDQAPGVEADPDIMILQGPGGLIVHSEDKEALARFQAMMQLFAEQAAYGAVDPTVIYLKNIKAAAAKELLETVLSGSAGSGGGGGTLLGDMAGSVLGGLGGGMFGAMLGGGGGGDLLTSGDGLASGDYTITADPRLNALIVKASPADMDLIEQLLEVIDQVESPIAVETRGQVDMIPVVTQDVTEVLNVIKQLYGDRIVGNTTGGASGGGGRGGGGGGGGGQPNPADIINALRGGSRGGRGGSTSTELAEAKISISAETSTNMLLVVAQPQDIAEIRQIVALIDDAGRADQEEIAFANLGGFSAELVQGGVTRILGPQAQANVTQAAQTGSSSSSSTSAGGGGGGEVSDAQRQAARQAFFDRIRQGGGFGGRPGGTGFGARGGGTGGPGGTSGRPGGFGGFGGGRPGGGGGRDGGGRGGR